MSMDTDPAKQTRGGYRQPIQATGKLAGEIIYLIALAITAGADVAAFYQILSLVLQQLGPHLIAVAVAGFTAMSLTLAHFAGRIARDRQAEHGPDDRRAVLFLVIPWGLLGLAAFAARLIVAQSQLGSASTTGAVSPAAEELSGAFLFLVLYLASGAVAGYGEYLTRNPYRAAYRAARRAYQRSLRRLDRSQAPYERALSVLEQHETDRQAEDAKFQAATALRMAHADELKRRAAHLIAAHLQDPSATDGMTRRDRIPFPEPPGGGPDDT
jgi:hypothetical protein